MKKLFPFFLFIVSINAPLFAQNGSNEKLKIAVFTPVYLDSAFDTMVITAMKKPFPNLLIPVLNFMKACNSLSIL
jgi:hypothetical protein